MFCALSLYPVSSRLEERVCVCVWYCAARSPMQTEQTNSLTTAHNPHTPGTGKLGYDLFSTWGVFALVRRSHMREKTINKRLSLERSRKALIPFPCRDRRFPFQNSTTPDLVFRYANFVRTSRPLTGRPRFAAGGTVQATICTVVLLGGGVFFFFICRVFTYHQTTVQQTPHDNVHHRFGVVWCAKNKKR